MQWEQINQYAHNISAQVASPGPGKFKLFVRVVSEKCWQTACLYTEFQSDWLVYTQNVSQICLFIHRISVRFACLYTVFQSDLLVYTQNFSKICLFIHSTLVRFGV